MATEKIDLLVKGGEAKGGAALGPKLGPLGLKMQDVLNKVNEKTASMKGMDVPVKLIVDTETKTFEIEVGTPPVSALLKKEANINKGSGRAAEIKVSTIAIEHAIKIAKIKWDDLLGDTLKSKVKEVIGTCVSAGILVEGKEPKEVLKEIDEGKYDAEINEEKTEIQADKLKALQAEQKRLGAEADKKQKEEKKEEAAAPAEGEEAAEGEEEKSEEKKE